MSYYATEPCDSADLRDHGVCPACDGYEGDDMVPCSDDCVRVYEWICDHRQIAQQRRLHKSAAIRALHLARRYRDEAGRWDDRAQSAWGAALAHRVALSLLRHEKRALTMPAPVELEEAAQ